MLRIRLSMGGVRKRPIYKIVIADSRYPRDGKFIEKIGSYNPLLPKEKKERIKVEAERVKYWMSKGAQPTMRVSRLLGEVQIKIDCDVIQADGGTRTASITGGTVALYKALQKINKTEAVKNLVAAVSVGICNDELLLDLDYDEDSNAQCDVNIVMNERLELIEVQGTGEESAFSKEQFKDLVDLAENGLKDLFVLQNEVIKNG